MFETLLDHTRAVEAGGSKEETFLDTSVRNGGGGLSPVSCFTVDSYLLNLTSRVYKYNDSLIK